MYLYGATMRFEGKNYQIFIDLEEVARWRKQNAIHNWMVENVQDGVDNCALYYLDKSNLEKLLAKCEKILKNPTPETAMEVLPTVQGFFFGGTDLNLKYEWEWYMDGIKYTVEVFRDLLKNDKFEYYYYQSSW